MTELPVTFDGTTLHITLPPSLGIKIDRFIATSHNYRRSLQNRPDMGINLRSLLAQLFGQRVVVWCSISFGRRLELKLADHNSQGKPIVLAADRLDKFTAVFNQVTRLGVEVTWLEPAGKGRRQNGDNSLTDFGAAMLTYLNSPATVADVIIWG